MYSNKIVHRTCLQLLLVTNVYVFSSADTCSSLRASPNAIVQELIPRSQYSVSCSAQRALFGPFSAYGEYAICQEGDYVIYAQGGPINIGHMVPSCVSKYLFDGCCLKSVQYFIIKEEVLALSLNNDLSYFLRILSI